MRWGGAHLKTYKRIKAIKWSLKLNKIRALYVSVQAFNLFIMYLTDLEMPPTRKIKLISKFIKIAKIREYFLSSQGFQFQL